MAVTGKLTWATIDITNDAEVDALEARDGAEAANRAKEAIAELQRIGILDANGRRIRTDVPPDMREDSDCDMSAI